MVLQAKLNDVFDYVSQNTLVRRQILNILAAKLSNKFKNKEYSVPKTGPPEIVVFNEKKEWTKSYDFVDSIRKFRKNIQKKDLKPVYNFCKIEHISEFKFKNFLVL
jgi:hypothetical protein